MPSIPAQQDEPGKATVQTCFHCGLPVPAALVEDGRVIDIVDVRARAHELVGA